MNIHEHQAKELLASYGLPILKGKAAFSVDDVKAILEEWKDTKDPTYVVKAQIHAGGRGKAGGVVVTKKQEEALAAAERLLGKTLVTHQTGPEGQVVNRLYVEQGCAIFLELYLSLLVDRRRECITVVASQAGGMDIEQVAAKTPQKIIHQPIDPALGYRPYHGRKIGFSLGMRGSILNQFTNMLEKMIKVFEEKDISLLEINPLVITKTGDLMILDAKISFDDSALFRQAEIEKLRDESEEEIAEQEANKHGLSYVKLDGSIGCMVNGAGLAMATMDIIKLHGGEPANFLDVGGGATQEKVTEALKIILKDPHVKAILINIFGGIMRCDVIAEGIVAAAKEISLTVPIVVRLQGTNRDMGKKILTESGLSLLSVDDLSDAASRVVQAAKENT